MVCVKRIVLDVLKPHLPDVLSFSQAISKVGDDYCVHSTVLEVDKDTETIQIVVEGDAIDFEAIQNAIIDMGGSLHSIDEAEVKNETSQ